jgi:hypothetical protein
MKRRHPEDDLQRAVCNTVLQVYKNQGRIGEYFHIPNGGWRSKVEASIMKGLGVKPGVADLAVMLAGGRLAFIELKVPPNKQTKTQLEFEDTCQEWNFPYEVCTSVEEVKDFLDRLIFVNTGG